MLFSPLEAETAGADLTALVTWLLAEVDQLRAEVAELRRENLELRQQAGYWRSRHTDAVRRIAALEQDKEQLRGEVRKLQAERFGRRSEKQSASDRSNELEDPADDKPKRPRGRQPGQPAPRRRDYSHLPAREEFIDLPEAERVCPHCRLPLKACGTEDSEQLDIAITVYRRVIRRRRGQRTCNCPGPRTFTAPPAPKLIPKSLLGVSVWVEILLDKFASYRPTQRLLEQWRLLGLDLAAGTITDGLQRLEPLFKPIMAALLQRNRQSHYKQADETRWLVLVEQQGKIGFGWWLWNFNSEDTVVYLLDESRSHRVPEDHYPPQAGGVLMVDRYSAYKAMLQVKNGTLILVFCWAHVRRDFVRVGKGWPELKSWALEWLRRIRDLYRWNRQRLAKPADPAPQAALRQAVAAMRQQLDTELADPALRTPARKVLTSLQEHWSGLTHFVDDPRIPMDNNLSERRLRGPALGRKNYYGSGARWSGGLAAALFSIFATLQLWQINPRLWLNWYLQSCAEAGSQVANDIEPFLPWNLSADMRAKLRMGMPTPKPDSS
ncbi:MAG TPA: IS66 family transposase [Gemmataceae bacterium]|nr:IS66 family transposase [Gemmataceae bacterium]